MTQQDADAALALELQQNIGFAVEPITNCPHLPASTANHQVHINQPCKDCGDSVENWQCLTCDTILCSRYRQGHMKEHVENSGHCVCLSYADLSVWCFNCNSYVTHQVLEDLKHKAYVAKFNQEPPMLTTQVSDLQDQGCSSK
ncbi:hypothetical protein BCR42DRAFT_401033 [Absidia repens]|uniref:UBP-type domain-containing protein n=1 Tax=Absidia repens TaxID=90262 RepID=A0A1X2J218_9FUNG|nr:hypothetical protein BCR42DRAFT_401033 [Absidia repens]